MHNRPATDLEAHINELYRLTTKIEICTGEIVKALQKVNEVSEKDEEIADKSAWVIGFEDWTKGFLLGPFPTEDQALEQPGAMKERIFQVFADDTLPIMTHRWNPKAKCWSPVKGQQWKKSGPRRTT